MRTRFTLGDAIASALTNDMLCRSLSNFAPHFSMCKYLHYSCRSSFNSSIASVMEGLLCLRHCPPLGTHSGSQSLQHLFFNRCDALIVECLPIYVRATTDQNTANAHLELDLLLDCLIINIPNSIILGLMQFFFPELSRDIPRVEPYAVGRWTPNEAGLYAQAALFPTGKLQHIEFQSIFVMQKYHMRMAYGCICLPKDAYRYR